MLFTAIADAQQTKPTGPYRLYSPRSLRTQGTIPAKARLATSLGPLWPPGAIWTRAEICKLKINYINPICHNP